MVTILILAIVLIPVCFIIYKKASQAWVEADKEEQEQELDEKLDEVKRVGRLHKKADKVVVDEVTKQKKRIEEVKKV